MRSVEALVKLFPDKDSALKGFALKDNPITVEEYKALEAHWEREAGGKIAVILYYQPGGMGSDGKPYAAKPKLGLKYASSPYTAQFTQSDIRRVMDGLAQQRDKLEAFVAANPDELAASLLTALGTADEGKTKQGTPVKRIKTREQRGKVPYNVRGQTVTAGNGL